METLFQKGYGYTYDALNRLTKASYGEKSGGAWNFGKYKVPEISYDYNGNITKLVRYGFCGQSYTCIDNLNYYYYSPGSNRLMGIAESADQYCGFRSAIPTMPAYYYDANGNMNMDKNLIQHIEDGSNAVFQLKGDNKSEEYFEFTGYDEKQEGENKVNVESAIQGAQDYTRENYTSDIDENGKCTQTYCNYGTMNIAKTYESAVEATGKTTDISDIKGSARVIGDNLSKSEAVKPATDLAAAKKAAQEGSLVVGYWPGHVFTLNKQGLVNNVGAPRAKNNVFDPEYTKEKGQKFFIIQVK